MRIFLTGAAGQLGRTLQHALDRHELIATDVDTVDITDRAALRRAVHAAHPHLVVHLAALTDVDRCAREPELALRINTLGTRHVALACQRDAIPMLHVSTNEVFDGTAGAPYYEWDPTHPLNPYAYSKWAAEQCVRELAPRHYVVRTAWLFARGGGNFVHKILQAAGEAAAGRRPALRVVTDEVANPTHAPDLAAAIAALVETEAFGTYHFVNAEHCSRYAFARAILDLAGYADLPIEPITLAEYPRTSHPPHFTALHNFVGAAAGITLRPWREALAEFIGER
jgi:dTDP-4-dehydrorhamnose reductase